MKQTIDYMKRMYYISSVVADISSEPQLQSDAGDKGGVELLLECIRKHRTNEKAMIAATWALWCLCKTDSNSM